MKTFNITVIEFFELVDKEHRVATTKFPGSNNNLAALIEEVGELATALMEESTDNVIKEAVQVAAVAMRIAREGDPYVQDNTWLPFEYAPKNGTPIHVTDGEYVVEVFWENNAFYCFCHLGKVEFRQFEPTHYRCTPKPPKCLKEEVVNK